MTSSSAGTRENAGEGTSLLGLPEQLLSSALLSRINSPTDFANARLACRSLASLVPLSVRFLDIKDNNLKSTGSLCVALSNLPNLEALSISSNGWGCVRGEDVNQVAVAAAQHCSNLVSFRVCMGGLRPLWATVLQLLLRLCPHLREVTVGDPQHMHAGNSTPTHFSFQPNRPRSMYQADEEMGSKSDLSSLGGTLSLPQHIAMAVDNDMVPFLGRADKQRVAHLNLWGPEQCTAFSDQGSAAKSVLEIAAQCRAATFLRIANLSFCVEGQQPDSQWNGPLLFEKLGCLGELRELRSLSVIGSENYRRASTVYPLPGSFQNLRQLVELSVKHVRAVGDIDVLCQLPRLTKLTVAYTGTPCVPEPVSLLTNLEVLRFCNCGGRAFAVPESLGHLSLLRELQLSELMMTSLPDSLAQLQRVTYLDLSGSHQLDTLPDSLLQMTALKELNITGCDDISPDDDVRCELRDHVQLHEDPEVMEFSEEEWDDWEDYDEEIFLPI